MIGSTLFLRIVIISIGLIIAGLCCLGLPILISSELSGDFDYGFIFIGMLVSAVPFFIGLYHAMKLLRLIDNNKAFSQKAVDALKRIKFCAFAISALYAAGMPYIFYVADKDDAPGAVAIGLVIIAATFVVATVAAVIQQLFQNAVDIKSENDLTV